MKFTRWIEPRQTALFSMYFAQLCFQVTGEDTQRIQCLNALLTPVFIAENGDFLALDLGGTNFRVLLCKMRNGHCESVSRNYNVPTYKLYEPCIGVRALLRSKNKKTFRCSWWQRLHLPGPIVLEGLLLLEGIMNWGEELSHMQCRPTLSQPRNQGSIHNDQGLFFLKPHNGRPTRSFASEWKIESVMKIHARLLFLHVSKITQPVIVRSIHQGVWSSCGKHPQIPPGGKYAWPEDSTW